MANINQATADRMRVLLASWTVFYQQTHVFHWNMVGSSFNELHKLLEELYNEAVEHSDSVAERIRQVGVPISLTLNEAGSISEVSGEQSASTPRSMIEAVLVSLVQLTSIQDEIFNEATDQNDYVTADLMTQLSKWNELKNWFLSSWLQDKVKGF